MKRFLTVVFVLCFPLIADEVRSGWWRGKHVVYRVVDGQAVAQGDILLEEISQEDPALNSGTAKNAGRDSVGRNFERYLWPDRTVPYVIDAGLSGTMQTRVKDAIAHWNSLTPMQLVERSNQTAYVRFVPKDGVCNSNVGMLGREQLINLGTGCSTGAVIHEIGHTVGLFHEQERNDRNFWMHVLTENADKRALSNFDQAFTSGQDLGGYDYGSIMHYGPSDFSRNGKTVLQSIPPGIPVGQRDGLSPGDLDAVKRMYQVPIGETIVSTYPLGLDVIVDGERVSGPRSFQWVPGSKHTISVPDSQTVDAFRYVFGRWSDDGPATHEITAGPDATVFTVAYIRQYRIPLTVSPDQGGKLIITPASRDGWYPDGTEIEVRAVPEPGWNFRQWAGFGLFSVHGLSPNPLKVAVRGPQTRYQAVFTQSAVTMVTSDPPGLTVQVDGANVVTPQGFVWTAGSSHRLTVSTMSQTTGNSTSRHEFAGWIGGEGATQTITADPDGGTFTAKFNTKHNVVIVQPSSGGRVDVTPDGDNEFWDAGTALMLRPTAGGTNRFLSWSGDLGGSDDPGSLTVDEQKMVSATFSGVRQLAPGGLVNAANFAFGGGVSPGSLVTLFGLEIGPESLLGLRTSGTQVVSDLSGYRVMFDDIAAPMIYAAKNQVAAVAPFGIAGKTSVTIRVAGPGWVSSGRIAPVIATNPALFTYNSSGRGPAAALNQDGSVNSEANPADRGSVVVLYGTGAGVMSPTLADGQVVGSALARPVQPVKVRIGGREAPVLYAGSAPGLVAGVLQVNVAIPEDTTPGAAQVVLGIGDSGSPGNVTIWVR